MKSVIPVVMRFTALCGALVLAAAAGLASAQGYPSKTVHIIVPFAPAGVTDIMARLLAQKYSESMGQQFLVENRAGAGGNIGMGAAAKAPPDGHTVLISSSSYVVNPSLYANAPYDPYKDFAPVTLAAATPNAVLVHPSVPAKTLQELVALIRANPGKYNYAQPGTGTTPHLSGELFRLSFKLDLVHVPFNGAGPAIAAVVGNQTPIAFAALPTATPHIKSGALRVLGLTSETRSALLPEVPTFAEAGAPGQEAETMQGIFVPAATPRDIVDRLHRETVRVIGLPDVREKLAALGFSPVANTPDQFAAYIKTEIVKWAKVVREANIKVD
jgi:tripartite-type tricarboxylate transporter receptor subunit TctC